MSRFINKDEDGFYVFDEREFLKTLPTGLEYFAVDKESKHIYGLGFNYKQKMDKQISDLEAKLAEKERQIKKLNNEAQKYFEDAYCNDFHNQEKISFCIEKFQETKKSLRDKVCLMGNDTHYYPQNAIHWQDVVAIIDNQINELKRFLEI